ncbi:MAG TPA: AraC family transcriptional regulator [Epsilonproteobacteria bacterium]|nr:AraC family transcriptional regulator [Campylobacterota bacterium]
MYRKLLKVLSSIIEKNREGNLLQFPMQLTEKEFSTVQSLVGVSITRENLQFVDSFVYDSLSIFIPVGGACGYAVSPNHSHPAYMFVLAYDSETEVVIGDRRITSQPDTLFCLSPEIEHHEVQHYLPPKYCAIFIDKALFESHIGYYRPDIPFLDGETLKGDLQPLDLLIKNFIATAQLTHPSSGVLLENLSTLMTHEIIRLMVGFDLFKADYPGNNHVVLKVVKYMNLHYEKEVTVDVLAEAAGLSKSHLTKIFGDALGMGPMEYLKAVRLKYAKTMLLSGQYRVTEVAQRCGFNSPSYFAKSFKAFYRETPKEFMIRQK